MKNLSLLSLAVLLAASPVAGAAWSDSNVVVATAWSGSDVVEELSESESSSSVGCGWSSGSSYGANSTYEANLRHLAAVLPAETSAAHGRSVDRAIGYWPNRVQARANCWSGDGDCATCIAEAFKELERVCPFRREASFFGRNCDLRLAEVRIFRIDAYGRNTMLEALAMGMMFQAFGLACLFFLFIQAWRHENKKGTMTRHTPLLSGDQ